jgi:hypothetical protein
MTDLAKAPIADALFFNDLGLSSFHFHCFGQAFPDPNCITGGIFLFMGVTTVGEFS